MREPVPGARGVRLRLASSAALLVLLAAAAVLLSTWLAERRGLRWRGDLTSAGANTLHPATREVLERLPGEVRVDLFFRPDEYPFERTSAEVQDRLRRLLVLLREATAGRVRVEEHDLFARERGAAAAEDRLRELGLEGVRPGGLLVVSRGARRAVLQVRGDLAEVDPGDPRPSRFVPARVALFKGEEALVGALLKVTQGAAPLVCFTSGHGEPDPYGDDAFDLGRLRRALIADGFRVERWSGEEQGELPEDCAILAVLGPQEPFSQDELARVRRFVERGGRLIVAPGRREARDEPGSLESLLERYGIVVSPGFLARARIDPATGAELRGTPDCTELYLGPQEMRPPHPTTEPLRLGLRRVRLAFTRALARGEPPLGAQLLPLLSTQDDVWRDLPDAPGGTTWVQDPDEEHGPFVVAMAATLPVVGAGLRLEGEDAPRREARVLVIGSALFFSDALLATNRDLALNFFNWAAERDFRVRISSRDPEQRRLPLEDARSMRVLSLSSLWGLPLLVLCLGLFTAWRRRR